MEEWRLRKRLEFWFLNRVKPAGLQIEYRLTMRITTTLWTSRGTAHLITVNAMRKSVMLWLNTMVTKRAWFALSEFQLTS